MNSFLLLPQELSQRIIVLELSDTTNGIALTRMKMVETP